MKAYTSIEQSKELAQILPIENADMCYGIDDDTLKYNNLPWLIPYHKYTAKEFYIPCWSLAALLEHLRKIDVFPEIDVDEFKVTMSITYFNDHEARHLASVHSIKVKAESFIDACVEVILNLHKLNLL